MNPKSETHSPTRSGLSSSRQAQPCAKSKIIRLLLAEDNPGDARLMQKMLAEAMGPSFELECADRLSTVLERLAAGGIDIALLDLTLPDSQGLHAFARAQEQAPQVPIIVLTGTDDEALAVKAIRKGAQDYLVKGQVDSNLLVRAIRCAIERGKKGEALRIRSEKAVRANTELKETNRRLRQAMARADRMARQAERVSAAKSEFLSSISHEIRTPINGVIGFSDMLLDSNLNKDQIDYAETIKRSSEILLSMVNDILDFSKVEAGQVRLERIDFDPEIMAYDVCQLIRPHTEKKSVEVLCRIGDNIPSQVKGDPHRFRQVMANLMGNAAKFTESGEIELALDIEEEHGDRVKLHAMVRDTGVGIPEDKLGMIFEPFKQADDSTTRKYGGTGLGLSICKQISRLIDGDVWAESEPGKGSTFHFTAWLQKSGEKFADRPCSAPLRGKKILIADDNQTSLDILGHILTLNRVTVVAVSKGQEIEASLVEALSEGKPFDMAVLDIQMEDMSGIEVARKIRKHKSAIHNIALLAFSASPAGTAKICLEAGFDGFLPKPVSREKLLKMMERLLGERRDDYPEKKVETILTQYSLREEAKRSMRIMLAEDNSVSQKLTKAMLTKGGYRVEVANDGKEAVEKFTADPDMFDLIFMDVMMPEMDGIDATKVIRDKGFDTIPIVAMTARTVKDDREKCLEAGMDDYVEKPIRREVVFEMINKWVLSRGKV